MHDDGKKSEAIARRPCIERKADHALNFLYNLILVLDSGLKTLVIKSTRLNHGFGLFDVRIAEVNYTSFDRVGRGELERNTSAHVLKHPLELRPFDFLKRLIACSDPFAKELLKYALVKCSLIIITSQHMIKHSGPTERDGGAVLTLPSRPSSSSPFCCNVLKYSTTTASSEATSPRAMRSS